MRNTFLTRWRTAVLAVAAFLTLGGCGSDSTGVESRLEGEWNSSTEYSPQYRVAEHLHLGADGTYAWTVHIYAPEGRPGDGLVETYTHTGEWEVRRDRLALRTLNGFGWRHPTGDYVADYLDEWNTQRKVRMVNSDQLALTYVPTPIQSISQYTTLFVRAVDNLR